MKTLMVLSILLLSFASFSQQDKREEIKALKVEYITSQLELTVEEAEKFWPIYHEMENKMRSLKKQKRALRPDESVESLSDEEIEELLKTHFKLKQKELDTEKEYTEKFKTVLPVKKVVKLRIAEEKFKRELLKRFKEHRKGAGRSGKPDPGSRRQ